MNKMDLVVFISQNDVVVKGLQTGKKTIITVRKLKKE